MVLPAAKVASQVLGVRRNMHLGPAPAAVLALGSTSVLCSMLLLLYSTRCGRTSTDCVLHLLAVSPNSSA